MAVAATVVTLTWWLVLGWSWPHVVYGFDDLAPTGVLAIREMAEGGDGWSSLAYRPDLLGGVKIANVTGRFPLYSLGARLGVPVAAIAALSAFIVHALLGWLGCRAAADLTVVWSAGARHFTRLERVAVVWLCAFAPALGWRFGVGHPAVVIGLLPFATFVALLTAAAARTTTITMVVGCIVATVLGLLHVSSQLVVYGAVFGLPIVVGLWLALGGRPRHLALPALVMLSAFLLALPALWGILAQARSSDSPRVLGETNITYSFITATAMDWLTSLPWMRLAAPTALRSAFAHEVNYPVGPLVVLLALVPWRRARALAVGLALGVVVLLVFSMDLAPMSRALLVAIPPLGLYRVPARAALVLLWVLPIVAVAALVHRTGARAMEADRWKTWATWLAIPLGASLLLLPPLAREMVVALIVAAVAVLMTRQEKLVSVPVVLCVLGLSSAAAFGERLAPYLDADAIIARAERIGAAVRAAKPELGSALTRARLDFEVPPLATNTAFAARLSTLDGYAIPTARFSALVSALRGTRYEPTANFFRFAATDSALPVLRQLYNETHAVTVQGQNLVITPLGPSAGSAWFSASQTEVEDVAAVAMQLRAAGDTLHVRAREVLWRNHGDPLAAQAPLPPTLDARCRDARVVTIRAPRGDQDIVVEVDTAATCPLTLAMNFTEDLRAVTVLADGSRVDTPLFPAYGALAAALVPGDARLVSVRPQPIRLAWAPFAVASGLACAVVALFLVRRATGPHGAPRAGAAGPIAG